MGRDPQTTPQSRRAEVVSATGGGAVPPPQLPSIAGGREEAGGNDGWAAALAALLTRDDGWLRVSPQDDGLTVYFKWKFTGGPHVNHYVMVVYPYTQCAEALSRLALKVHAVDCGKQRPVKDHYFKS